MQIMMGLSGIAVHPDFASFLVSLDETLGLVQEELGLAQPLGDPAIHLLDHLKATTPC